MKTEQFKPGINILSKGKKYFNSIVFHTHRPVVAASENVQKAELLFIICNMFLIKFVQCHGNFHITK